MPSRNDIKNPLLEKLIDMIVGLISDGFYGSIEIKFEKGVVQIIRKTESIKLS